MKNLFALFLLLALIACSKVDTSNQTEFLFYIIENQEDMNDFKAINEVYAYYFKESNAQARETVEVARLPKDVNIEISMIAVKG